MVKLDWLVMIPFRYRKYKINTLYLINDTDNKIFYFSRHHISQQHRPPSRIFFTTMARLTKILAAKPAS